jgi:hypothetical protein
MRERGERDERRHGVEIVGVDGRSMEELGDKQGSKKGVDGRASVNILACKEIVRNVVKNYHYIRLIIISYFRMIFVLS